MALAPSRQIFDSNIDYALNAVAERGVIVSIIPGTTADGEVTVAAVATGVNQMPMGVLLDDVEDMNFDRHPEYRQRNVVDVGSVIGIAPECEVWTDQYTGSTPIAGRKAYLGTNGSVTMTQATDGNNLAPLVGKFLSVPNANGFVKVAIRV